MSPDDQEALDALVSELSHTLKTPLAAIAGYSELLQTRDDDAIRREAPRRIAEAAERLSDAIDLVSAALAVDYGAAADLEPGAVDLSGAVEAAGRVLLAREERRIDARTENGAWPLVRARPGEVERLIGHAVLGAARESPGKDAVRVVVSRVNRNAVLRVEGAPVSQHGIGVLTARFLAERQGGTLAVDGAGLTITLPLADETS